MSSQIKVNPVRWRPHWTTKRGHRQSSFFFVWVNGKRKDLTKYGSPRPTKPPEPGDRNWKKAERAGEN